MQQKGEIILGILVGFFVLLSIGLLTGLLVHIYVIDKENAKEAHCPEAECVTDKTGKQGATPSRLMSQEVCNTKECISIAAKFLDSMNTSVNPCGDFYEFMCGHYSRNHHVPSHSYSVDVFTGTGERANAELRKLLEERIRKDELDSVKKMKKFYRICMDTEKNEKNGLEPLKKLITELGGWSIAHLKDSSAIAKPSTLIANMLRLGLPNNVIKINISPDPENLTINRITLDQPFAMASRVKSYMPIKRKTMMSDGDGGSEEVKLFMKKVISLIGKFDSRIIIENDINKIIEIEKVLPEMALPTRERHDPFKMNNRMTIQELLNLSKKAEIYKIDLVSIIRELFQGIKPISMDEEIIVVDIDYVKRLSVLEKYHKKDLTNYIMWMLVSSLLPHLPSSATKLHADRLKKNTMLDTEPRWMYCLSETIENMEEPLGRLYVDRYGGKEIINSVDDLITRHIKAYDDMILQSTWMSESSKKEALKKSENVKRNIAFPTWLLEDEKLNEKYENIELYDNHFENVIYLKKESSLSNLKEHNETVDRNDWHGQILVANAFYTPILNLINFPLVPLREPLFDINMLKAINYGAIGSTIGHEIGHAYDNVGSKFDDQGTLRIWWDEHSKNVFENKTKCYIDQFNKYCPIEMKNEIKTCLDGTNTLGENIADDTGLKSSFKAYKNWIKENGEEKRLPGLEKYSAEQLFFMSHAYSNCQNILPTHYYYMFGDEVHAPNKYRVIGVMENFPEFYDLFSCQKPKSQEFCNIW